MYLVPMRRLGPSLGHRSHKDKAERVLYPPSPSAEYGGWRGLGCWPLSSPCACQRKDPDSLGVWGEPKESDGQRRASVVPSGLTPCRAQASGLRGHLHRDQATAFRPRVARGTGGLGVAASHLTGGCIAAYSSPGLEAEESVHSIGNHH